MNDETDCIQAIITAVRKDFTAGQAGLSRSDALLFEALERQLVKSLSQLYHQAQQGEIIPDFPLRLSISDAEFEAQQILSRRPRIGFLATTGDPVHWGHVLRALTDAAEFQLDTVILQVMGDHPHKPVKRIKVHRHAIARLIADMFHPLIRYCPLGYDNLGTGEQNAAEFLLLNARARVELFFLAGDDVAAQAIGNIEACHRLLAGARGVIHPFSLKIVVGRDVVENIYPMGRIPDWIAVRSAPSRPLPECRGLPISSQLFRTHPELPLLPRQALDYIREHGLYQAAPSPESQLHLQSTVILSFLPPGLHQLVAEELTNTEELPPLLPHGRGLTTGILGEKRVTLLAAAGKETSLLPVMERSEVRTVLGIGLCGSFQAWLQPGTIVLPSAAIRGEGITCYWADPRFSPTPDFGLLRALVNGAEALGLHPRVGPLYTTASLAHERQIAATFSPLGVLGVEMELAVHWTLAALHGKRAASIYVASDNIVLGDDILRTGIAETPLLQRAVKAAVATLTQMMVTHAEG